MKVFFQSDVGKVRQNNQDCADGCVLTDGAWAIVCDGMGGASGGDIASRTAVEAVKSVIAESWRENISPADIEDLMRGAAAKANKEVFNLAVRDPELNGMGTTLVLVVVKDDKLYTAHAGDSRAYLVSGDSITRLTKDHSLVQTLVDRGELDESEAEVHPKKNIITRALGVNSFIDIDFAQYEYHQNDAVLLCSDGLTNHVSCDEIIAMFKKSSGQALCEELVEEANRAGGKDNISVAIIENE